MVSPEAGNAIYRVDKFVVPESSVGEFSALVERTHEVLRQQPGFKSDLVLRQVGGPGRFNVTTVVAWESPERLEAAVGAINAFHEAIGFDRTATPARLGVEADIGIYRDFSHA